MQALARCLLLPKAGLPDAPELQADSSPAGLCRNGAGVAAVRCRRVCGARLALAPGRRQQMPSLALPVPA